MRGKSNIMAFERIKATHFLAPSRGKDARRAGLAKLDELANKGVLIHRIPHSPFLSQLIHLFHD